MNPKVSVVIPCYNSSEHLDRGLQSILNQTYKNIEIICVDNNSTDNTLGKLKTYEGKYANLTVVSEQKQGAPFARNKGTELAQGEWIQYFDIDDELLPNKIQHQINLINESPSVEFILERSRIQKLDGGEHITRVLEDRWKGVFSGGVGNTNSVLIKKELIDKAGGWDENLKSSQERELFFRILKLYPKTIRSEKINSIIYKRNNSISTNRSNGNTLRYVKLRVEILHYLIENNLIKNEADYQWYLNHIFRSLRLVFKIESEWTIEEYNKLCKNRIKLKTGNGISYPYKILYKLLGFRLTEKFY